MNENPFGITREEILDLAAQKLADQFCDMESLHESVTRIVTTRVNETVATKLTSKIDEILTAELTRLLSEEIVPVNIWGEREGKPTTIKAALSEQARKFWDQKVNADGKLNDGYGGKPRHEWLFGKIVQEEFSAVVKQNVVNIVGALKDALRADAVKTVTEQIDNLIRVKTK